MKICHFIASSLFGGAEKVVINLCNEMSKDNEVVLITFDKYENLKNISSDVSVYTFKEFKRYNIFALLKLLKLINKIDPDIINSHGAKATRIIYNIQNRINCPFVGTKHNARRGKIFNKINNIISVSNDSKKSVLSKNVKVIYNGVEPIEVISSIKNEIFTILAVGRLDKIKGFDKLIESCGRLKFPFLLEIVGDGKEKSYLEELILKYNLEDSVKLLGFREDIPQIMKNAHLVVTSSYSEGFSLVMVESLFYANLFISTKVSGATEILDDRFLFDIKDMGSKIEDIYQNYDIYKKLFKNLQDKVKKKLLLSNIALEYIDLYQKILEEKK